LSDRLVNIDIGSVAKRVQNAIVVLCTRLLQRSGFIDFSRFVRFSRSSFRQSCLDVESLKTESTGGSAAVLKSTYIVNNNATADISPFAGSSYKPDANGNSTTARRVVTGHLAFSVDELRTNVLRSKYETLFLFLAGARGEGGNK